MPTKWKVAPWQPIVEEKRVDCTMWSFSTGLTWIYLVLLFSTNIKAIRVIGQDVTVTAGADAQIFWQLVDTAESLTSIRWQRRTKEKPTNADFLVVTSDGKKEHINGLKDRVKFTGSIKGLDGSIILSNASVFDEGIYSCIFSVFPSGPFKTEIRFTVQVPPIVSVNTAVPAVAGDTEEILATCTAANAKPAAEVLWNLGALNGSVKLQSSLNVDSEGRYTVKSSLIGKASKNLNQKAVQCLIKHPGLKENLEINYTLNIHYPPQVVHIISRKIYEFQCEADANPKPTNFIWSRYFPVKEPLYSGVKSTQIIQQTPESNGFYYCVASNQHGEAVGSLYMQIKPPAQSQTCWTLFIIFIVVVVVGVVIVFLVWKYNLCHPLMKILSCNKGKPVPIPESSDSEEKHHTANGLILSTGIIP